MTVRWRLNRNCRGYRAGTIFYVHRIDMSGFFGFGSVAASTA
jgi:hypothetical protein